MCATFISATPQLYLHQHAVCAAVTTFSAISLAKQMTCSKDGRASQSLVACRDQSGFLRALGAANQQANPHVSQHMHDGPASNAAGALSCRMLP